MGVEPLGFSEQEDKEIVKKQQHKETRHNAIDAIIEIRSKYTEKYTFPSAEQDMFNEMCGAIMNLKQ